jgi:hypothetical protein
LDRMQHIMYSYGMYDSIILLEITGKNALYRK